MQNDDTQCNNPNLDLVSINAYTQYDENLSICSQDIEQAQILSLIKHHNSGIDERIMTCSNPILDPVNIKAYTKFDDKSVNLLSRY